MQNDRGHKQIRMLISKYTIHFVLVVSLVLSGCSDDGDDPSSDDTPTPDVDNQLDLQILDDLLATWEASQAKIEQIDSQSPQEIDLIVEGGAGTLIVFEGGSFVMPLLLLDGEGIVYTGEFFVEDAMLRVLFDNNPGDTIAWNMQLSTNSLILQGRALYDFIGDGTLEDALIDLDLDRSN